MDRNWLIHESPSLKPGWLRDIKLFFVKNSYMLLYNIFFKYFSSNRRQRYWTVVFQILFISFFVWWNHISHIFLFSWKFPIFKTWSNNLFQRSANRSIANFYHWNTYHIMTMRFIIGSSSLIIFRTTSLVKWTVDSSMHGFLWKNRKKITVCVCEGIVICKKPVKYFNRLFKACDEFIIV